MNGICECGCGEPVTSVAKVTDRSRGRISGKPYRFLRGHQRPRDPNDFWVADENGCHVWIAARGADGYGRFTPPRARRQWLAHRFFYERAMGPVPEGFELDHLCRNRLCCNPAHLEPVSHLENVRRGEHGRPGDDVCRRGHLLDARNTYVAALGNKVCRRCQADWAARKRASLQLTKRGV